MTKDEAQRRRWTFYEAVKEGVSRRVGAAFQRLGPGMSMVAQLPPEQDLLVTAVFGEPELLPIT